jgi:hypothetical protein
MSITLKKSNGDLFLHPETGRAEIIEGASKVDQELADLYLSDYDSVRQWGASFDLRQLQEASTSIEQARMILFLRLQQANDRILQKQANDPTLTFDEKITSFSQTDVIMDLKQQAVIFYSQAEVGDTTVDSVMGHSFKATDLNHVHQPPVGLTPKE